MKMCLTDDNIQRILRKQWLSAFKCPECRGTVACHVLKAYAEIMDKYDEFTDSQQRALVFAQQNDPEYGLRYPLKHLRKGVIVLLYGLENKKWDGKEARIIGEGVHKNGIFKVPVQLMDGSKSTALIKQTNMAELFEYDESDEDDEDENVENKEDDENEEHHENEEHRKSRQDLD